MRAVYLISPVLLFAPSWVCHAGETSFSDGLKRLAELGLPPMEGAQWVKIPGDSEQHFSSSYQFQEMDAKLSGNTWKLPAEPTTYLDFGSAVTTAPESENEKQEDEDADSKPGLLGKMLLNYQEKNPEPEKKPKAPKPTVSLAAEDAAKLVKALAKSSVAEHVNQGAQYGHTNLHGRLMLFAAQLQAAGETESANTLAAALFQAIENDAALIDGAISHLADTGYDTAARAFFETNDWKAYHTAIKALLEKFPRGWANAPAVALLSSHLEKRSATPPPLTLPGIAIKPEALALLDKLLVKQTIKTNDEALAKAQGVDLSRYPARQRAQMILWLRANAGEGVSFSDPTLWLLPSEKSDDEPSASPIEALKAMRMDGFIALAAAIPDETLVPIQKQNDGHSYYSSNESPAAVIRRRYANLARPISRGEIAAALISSAIPTPEDPYSNSSEPDPADLAAKAIEFWKTNKDKSAVELATLYIAEGNTNQRTFASSYLASSKDPAAHAAFEKTALNSNDPLSLIQAVEGYLGARKAAAKPFATAYIKLIRDNPPNEEELERGMVGYQIREAGGIENYLKKLSLKVGDVSLDKMIAQALRAKPKEDESGAKKSPIEALWPAIQGMPLHECLTAFGKAASIATPEQWMEIHLLLRSRIFSDYRSKSMGEELKTPPPLPDGVIALWKPLISRTDSLPEKSYFADYTRSYGGTTTGDASALLMELAAGPSTVSAMNNFAVIEGSSSAVMAFIRERNTALAKSETPKPWPSATNISEARTQGISSNLATLKKDEIIPYAKSLSRDERLSLMRIIQSYRMDNPASAGLLELRQTIVNASPIFEIDHDRAAAAKLGIRVGDKITPELITRIADGLLKNAVAGSTTTVTFTPAPMYLGSTFLVTTAKNHDPTRFNRNHLSYVAGRFRQLEGKEPLCYISIDNQDAADIRTLEDGKPVTLESENSALDFLTKSLEAKTATLPVIRITVLTRADAEKINNQDQ